MRKAASFVLALLLSTAVVTSNQIVSADLSGGAADAASGLKTIYIDKSDIIHVPQEDAIPVGTPGRLRTAQEITYGGPFGVGDTRDFLLSDVPGGVKTIQGKLMAQGEYTNVWVLDDADYHSKTNTTHSPNCHLNDITAALAKQIADSFDPIYLRMTDEDTGFAAHAEVEIKPGYGNLTAVGDIGKDSKVNFLLYDINGDGGSGAGFTAGYFASGDFFTSGSQLDMLHIDVGEGQGYRKLVSEDTEDNLSLYSTLAHEFQHMLYYMYFGVYRTFDGKVDSWFNETLSAHAETYYTTDAKLVDISDIFSAADNVYDGDGDYSDFLNHGSFKTYAMERMLSIFLYNSFGADYAHKLYAYLQEMYPPASNASERQSNQNKITGHDQAVGDYLQATTDIGGGGVDTLSEFYFSFMESFAADGGTVQPLIVAQPPTTTAKFYDGRNDIDNLWAIRPALGTNTPLYITGSSGGAYTLDDSAAIPLLATGGAISLVGYGTNDTEVGATHEMLYKLTGDGSASAGTPYLTISVPADSGYTRYYVCVPDADTANGASVYPLAEGSDVIIDTEGKQAYLFAATFHTDVTTSAAFSWSAAEPPGILWGDFTGDGYVTDADCEWIQKYIASGRDLSVMKTTFSPSSDTFNEAAGDFTNNGRVDAADILWILRYIDSGNNKATMTGSYSTTINFGHLS
ncbi:MAG: dockerin type I repeat-containing protein [Clostridiales bacterium]|jgi:hypothetical protein|nr:dockerin type I repeat-containing protein [Clostridiales bacterium]